MRYYVTADPHSYFRAMKAALTEKGFFKDREPHKLIICGDLFDRGEEAAELQKFILDLMDRDQVILIRGNHEDLALDLLDYWNRRSYLEPHHHTNGTIDTVIQLINSEEPTESEEPPKFEERDLYTRNEDVCRAFMKTPFITKIIPAMVDYYETDHYIFTHGWIPCTAVSIASNEKEYIPVADWHSADETAWKNARWINGMEAAHHGILERGKTIVCGHWHTSFGHSRYESDGGEFDNNPNFSPYCADGIIALDACTAISGKVNCIVIED